MKSLLKSLYFILRAVGNLWRSLIREVMGYNLHIPRVCPVDSVEERKIN